MKNSLLLVTALAIMFVFLSHPAPAQQNPGDVWVPEKALPSGVVIPGYWRPPFRQGFYWVEGKEDEDGNWIPGHWRPVPGSRPRDRAWVPGYWDGEAWVEGFWRPYTRPGYIWIDPHWRDGRRYDGHWRAYVGGQPWHTRYPRR